MCLDAGALYVVYDGGGKISYLEEAKKSIASLRKFSDLPVTVYVDRADLISDFDKKLYNITVITKENIKSLMPPEPRIDKWGRGYTFLKLYIFKEMPYDTTIFIDTDTLFFDDPSQLISKDYDLAICREAHFSNEKKGQLAKNLNTGFFVVHKSKVFDKLIKKAIEIREEFDVKCDQAAINLALNYIYDINIKILPQQWNIRPPLRKFIDNAKMYHWH